MLSTNFFVLDHVVLDAYKLLDVSETVPFAFFLVFLSALFLCYLLSLINTIECILNVLDGSIYIYRS